MSLKHVIQLIEEGTIKVVRYIIMTLAKILIYSPSTN